LRDAVVGDEKLVGGKFVDVLAGFGFDLYWHLYERGAHGKRGGRVLRLLGDGRSGG